MMNTQIMKKTIKLESIEVDKDKPVVDRKDRKEKLRLKMLNESQNYYQNNLNVFSNSMSMFALNTLETHGLVH